MDRFAAPEALVHAVPVAKLRWQVAPRRANPGNPEYGVHEQAVVFAASPSVALFTRHKSFDALPIQVRQFPPNQDRLPELRS